MKKNVKYIFFTGMLILLLLGVSAVTAADNDTVNSDIISNTPQVASTDAIAREEVQTASVNTVETNTKTIEKTDKNIKTSTQTVEVNNYEELINVINETITNTENEEYIINLNEGSYTSNDVMRLNGASSIKNKIIINGNNQTIKPRMFYYNMINSTVTLENMFLDCSTAEVAMNNNLILKNVNFTYILNRGNLTVLDSILTTKIISHGRLIINDNTNFTDTFQLDGVGEIVINNTERIIPYMQSFNGNITINDMTINSNRVNNGNLTIRNSVLNSTITNKGILVIEDDVTFGENFGLVNSGTLIMNDTNRIYPYLTSFSGNSTFTNLTIDKSITNSGNMTIIESSINSILRNYGNLTIKNSTINAEISNEGILNISDDTIFGDNFSLSGNGEIIIDDINRIIPYISYYAGNYTLKNVVLNTNKVNRGNLTIVNSLLISGTLSNYGNMLTIDNSTIYSNIYCDQSGNATIINSNLTSSSSLMAYFYCKLDVFNSTIDSSVTNYGTVTFDDNVIFKENFNIQGSGTIIINDTSKIAPYLSEYNGNYTLENITINRYKENNGNLTIKNSTINATIRNSGTLVIADDVTFGEKFGLTNNGNVIINDTNKIYPYTNRFSGNSTLKNITIDKQITNNGNLTLTNVTINNTISNSGILIINDDCIIGENTIINGNGQIIINNTAIIAPYLNTYNGTYTLENMTINKTKTNNGNLTIKNSTLIYGSRIRLNNNGNLTIQNTTINMTINNNGDLTIEDSTINTQITNNGNLTIQNTTINSTINNNGNLTISDDVQFGENFLLSGNGEVIINDTNKIAPYLSTYNGNYTLENLTITSYKENLGNLTITNSTIDESIYNEGTLIINTSVINEIIESYGNLTISNSTINSNIINEGILILDDHVEFGENFLLSGNGEIITNNSDRLLPYLTNLNGNYTLENINITTNKINNGNLTLINSNINSRIINYGDLKLINCSLSNNIIQRNPQNTNLDYSSLIYNNNTLYMENCIISNNTLNSFNVINGGNITIENCTFTNNTNITPYYTIWKHIIQANNINMNNCYFEDNAMCIGFGNLILTNSIFKNNKYIHLDTSVNNEMCNPSGIVLSGGNLYVNNSTFEDNGLISRLNTNQEGGFGGVILAYNATVINSVFKNNVANTSTTWTFPTGSGAALYITHGQIINNTFENNTAYNPSTITIPSIGQMFYGYMDIQGLINGCGADIYATGTVNIQNNTFKDSKASNAAGSIYAIQTLENTQINITDNTFNNIVSSLDTIVVENPNDYYKTVIENNIYENTTIDDELTLNIPEKTYEGEPITITGTYTIKNESFYDKNLIDKVKFNVYLNGVLNQTVDKLEFNITPTAGNMILLVQPTISKTKKICSSKINNINKYNNHP